jgi:hypothetical protein
MTLENAKMLYKHFVEHGMSEQAEEIARGRPEVLEDEEIKSKKKK